MKKSTSATDFKLLIGAIAVVIILLIVAFIPIDGFGGAFHRGRPAEDTVRLVNISMLPATINPTVGGYSGSAKAIAVYISNRWGQNNSLVFDFPGKPVLIFYVVKSDTPTSVRSGTLLYRTNRGWQLVAGEEDGFVRANIASYVAIPHLSSPENVLSNRYSEAWFFADPGVVTFALLDASPVYEDGVRSGSYIAGSSNLYFQWNTNSAPFRLSRTYYWPEQIPGSERPLPVGFTTRVGTKLMKADSTSGIAILQYAYNLNR